MDRGESRRRQWETVQASLADQPGPQGVERRQEAYQPFFLKLGRGVIIHEGCRFTHPERIVLEDDVRINCQALIYGSGGVRLGRHARIGPRLFLHSANHCIDPDEKAFFERGHRCRPIVVGDNCLISANVSILAGVRLGAGSFVACGAVVTGGEYPQGGRLMGVPARDRSCEVEPREATPAVRWEPAPTLAIAVPGQGRYSLAARLLTTVLGLPQVAVILAGEDLPDSVLATIAMGPPDWRPESSKGILWRLDSGSVRIEGDSQASIPDGGGGLEELSLPGHRVLSCVDRADSSGDPLRATAELSMYYALKRLSKRARLLSEDERLSTWIAAWFLQRQQDAAALELCSGMVGAAVSALPDGESAERGLAQALSFPGQGEDRDSLLSRIIPELAKVSEIVRSKARREGDRGYSARTFLQCPELLIGLWIDDRKQALQFKDDLLQICGQGRQASRLACLGLACQLLEAPEAAACALRRLTDPSEFWDEEAFSVRSALGLASYCYSPLLAVFLTIGVRHGDPDFAPAGFPPPTLEFGRPIALEAFRSPADATEEDNWTVRAGAAQGRLVDEQAGRISRSLLESWLAWLTVPDLQGRPLELRRECYRPAALRWERIWLALFRRLLHSCGSSLLQASPWPGAKRAAISLRYDIDRVTSLGQLQDIVDLQAEFLEGPAATWFALSGTSQGDRLVSALERSFQEIAVHALRCSDTVPGRGVTCHSGPTSQYWRGMETIAGFERGGASYAEMLAGQGSVARPGWIEQGGEGRPTGIWLVPIHYPLEGSTEDCGLEYFDILGEEFRDLLECGGHAIVGSHPDLDQEPMRRLLKRERLEDVWAAPIGEVVQRCRDVLDYGNIRVVRRADGSLCLLSRRTLADLQLVVHPPAGEARRICIQLNGGIPRQLESTSGGNENAS